MYSIKHHAGDSYVRLTLQGEASLTEFEQARTEVGALLATDQTSRLLVDVRELANMVTTLELFQFNSSHNEILPHGVRIAALVRSDQMPDGLFSENVAQNRGTMLRVFTDDGAAVSWLKSLTD